MNPRVLFLSAMAAHPDTSMLGPAGELPRPQQDPDDVRRLADEILARPAFAPPDRSWIDRALDWVRRQLERLFGGGDTDGLSGGQGEGGSSLLTVLLLAVAVALVVFLVWHWRRPGRRPADGDDVEFRVDQRRSAVEWDDAAQRAESGGDWKEGLRCRFAGLVSRLVAGGALPPVPGRTAGEFRGDVRESVPAAADEFAEAASLFERAWYGDLPTGPAEAERFAAHAGNVLEASRGAR